MRPVLLVALALSLAACGSPPPLALPTASAAARAQAAGGFRDLSGNLVSLAQAIGHPVVLSFLSPTNWDSGAEVPQLIRLAGAFQPSGVQFIVVGEGASVQDLLQWATQNQLPFPVWQDPSGIELADRGFQAVPATQFLGAAGTVIRSEAGFLSRGQLLAGIARITQGD